MKPTACLAYVTGSPTLPRPRYKRVRTTCANATVAWGYYRYVVVVEFVFSPTNPMNPCNRVQSFCGGCYHLRMYLRVLADQPPQSGPRQKSRLVPIVGLMGGVRHVYLPHLASAMQAVGLFVCASLTFAPTALSSYRGVPKHSTKKMHCRGVTNAHVASRQQ